MHQYARLPCSSLSPRVCSKLSPLSQWCYLIVSSSAAPSSLCHQSFPATGCFPITWLFIPDGQSIGASSSVLPMNIQGWFPLGLTGWISLQSKGLSRVFSSTTIWKHPFFSTQLFLWAKSHPYLTTRKTLALTIWNFVGKMMSQLFNMLFRFVIVFFSKEKIPFNFTVSNDFGSQENKTCHCFSFYLPWSEGTGCQDSFFTILVHPHQETL